MSCLSSSRSPLTCHHASLPLFNYFDSDEYPPRVQREKKQESSYPPCFGSVRNGMPVDVLSHFSLIDHFLGPTSWEAASAFVQIQSCFCPIANRNLEQESVAT